MLYVYIVTAPHREPKVFVHATHVKASVRLTHSKKQVPRMLEDRMERMVWEDGTTAVLTPVLEREDHL